MPNTEKYEYVDGRETPLTKKEGKSSGFFNWRQWADCIIIDMPENIVKCGNDGVFKETLVRACETGKHMGINFKKTKFIDTSTITALITIYDRTWQRGTIVGIIGPAESVREVFATTHLDRIFQEFESEARFLKHCEGHKATR
ncbi:MAG: hypothetical protein A2268_12160 [Candidatus Raymondbacteria bacterium RifOxyA12_full_50_37]|uniref:STAS domain-containing protein n=1 Tax=Candidatus Raymondbacteria bacterium RIFOXYD12_FULL_49_13 TaxID=1817890 RepID=A0A1F7F2W6_UNCRA|nr:MAG: hypothetical protein A2268_12160 [Candidatus Raymondbacteria bacterium RifOxyA12_full_50_37]OGJ90299.1 MAG: hypothetical protein A2248_00045 [Candidatus Raymondbacteria bacterium RIFOXYA2_FULL_49_16]OGJ97289.1 MAG: hypothetical protein A2453_01505 [Candidatus Raymondbacteria bacterium RIFOXYC2_FULL_50_21]OGK00902.1 MAG: hypothetical protein A2519_12675 [Candidatus Raymondbacteria bacterium RIFOXYD12_FULL_49_13]OGK02513.1 MAG: hypothetical protein A2350_09950 [Candidatus Raymondbacteria 